MGQAGKIALRYQRRQHIGSSKQNKRKKGERHTTILRLPLLSQDRGKLQRTDHQDGFRTCVKPTDSHDNIYMCSKMSWPSSRYRESEYDGWPAITTRWVPQRYKKKWWEWNTITVKEIMAMLACLELFLSLNLLCDLGHFIQLLEFNKARYNWYRVPGIYS